MIGRSEGPTNSLKGHSIFMIYKSSASLSHTWICKSVCTCTHMCSNDRSTQEFDALKSSIPLFLFTWKPTGLWCSSIVELPHLSSIVSFLSDCLRYLYQWDFNSLGSSLRSSWKGIAGSMFHAKQVLISWLFFFFFFFPICSLTSDASAQYVEPHLLLLYVR